MAAAATAVRTSTRDRKAVEPLVISAEVESKHEIVVPQGSGTALGEIPNVKHFLAAQAADSDLLKAAHHLLYKSQGKKHNRKKNLRAFNGFADAADQEKLVARLSGNKKWNVAALRDFAKVLDVELPAGASKEDIIALIAAFLQKPSASGRPLPSNKRKRAEKPAKAPKAKSPKAKAAAKPAAAKKPRKASGEKKTGEKKAATKKTAGKKAKATGPKRPLGAYMLFCKSARAQLKADNPEASTTEMAGLLGKAWRALDDAAKAPFQEEAATLKAAFDANKAAAN